MEKQNNSLTNQFKIIDEMGTLWPSNIVARKEVGKFSGGTLSGKTLANEDSKGVGPEGSFMLCNQRVYPVKGLVEYLKARVASKWDGNVPGGKKRGA